MITHYLAFNFYVKAFGGGEAIFAREDNNPGNPVMHASIFFTQYEGGITER